jgi:hypothetical protein
MGISTDASDVQYEIVHSLSELTSKADSLIRQQFVPIMINPQGKENIASIYTEILTMAKVGVDGSVKKWIFISSDAGATDWETILEQDLPIHIIIAGGHLRFKTLRQLMDLCFLSGFDEVCAAMGLHSIPQQEFVHRCKNIHKSTDLLMKVGRVVVVDDIIIQYWKSLLKNGGDAIIDVHTFRQGAMNLENLYKYLFDDRTKDVTFRNNVDLYVVLLSIFKVQLNGEHNESYVPWDGAIRELGWLNHALGNINYARGEMYDHAIMSYQATPEVVEFRKKHAFHRGQPIDLNTEQSVRAVKAVLTSRSSKGFLCASALRDPAIKFRAAAMKAAGLNDRGRDVRECMDSTDISMDEDDDDPFQHISIADNFDHYYNAGRKFLNKHSSNVKKEIRFKYVSFSGKRTNPTDSTISLLKREGERRQLEVAEKMIAKESFKITQGVTLWPKLIKVTKGRRPMH